MGPRVTWLWEVRVLCFSQLFPGHVPPALSLLVFPAPWPLQRECSWGRGSLPSTQSSLPRPVLHSRRMAKRLLSSLLLQPFEGYSKADGTVLIHNKQQANELACLSAWVLLCTIYPLLVNAWPFCWSLCSCWELVRERSCLEGPFLSLARLWSLRSGFSQVSSSLRAAGLSAGY